MKGVDVLGWNVLYYRNADKRNEPLLATVVSCHGNGINVHVHANDSPNIVFKHAVHHIDDDVFRTNAALARSGGWDVLPRDKKLFEQMKQQALAAAEKRQKEREAAAAAVKSS